MITCKCTVKDACAGLTLQSSTIGYIKLGVFSRMNVSIVPGSLCEESTTSLSYYTAMLSHYCVMSLLN